MASAIQTYLNRILNAVYGRDVRSSIHDAIELCYDDVSSGKTIAETAAGNVNTAIDNATSAANAANSAATSANSAADSANSAAASANAAASDATDAATSANTAAGNADNAATSANNAASSATTAASNANSAAQRAEDAVDAIGEISIDADAAISAVSRCNTAAENANTATTNANLAATAANSAAENANTKASAADSAANSCSTAATNANLAATNANNARDSANAAVTDANNARDAANTAANNANSAAGSANNAATSANSAANSATSKISAMDSKIFDATAATNAANTAAANANSAAISANTAADVINNLTVDSEDVGPNTQAQAILQTIDGHKNIHFLLRQGASGASFIIKGHVYDTLADLQADITNPEMGDQYNVGTAAPYHVYRWTGESWEDQGTFGSSGGGGTIESLTASDVQAIQNGREIEGAATKVMKAEGLTYLIHTLLSNALGNKVDKVTGKGLSTNDYTTEEKSLLADLNTAVTTLSDSKVDKVTGKGLSTNDLTNELLDKISLIGEGTLSTTASTIIAAINELVTGLAAKANLASPTFTGTPVAPTATSGTNTTQIATTEFVQSAVSGKANTADVVVDMVYNPTNRILYQQKNDQLTSVFTADNVPTSASNNLITSGAVYTAVNRKQNSNIYMQSVSVAAGDWGSHSDSLFSNYSYRASIANTSVTSSMFAMVTFAPTEVLSGNYAPACQTYNGGIYIYSKVNTAISIPTIAIFK